MRTEEEREDAAEYAHRYRLWRQHMTGETPLEYHSRLDLTDAAFEKAREADDDDE